MAWADQLRISKHKVFLSLSCSDNGDLEELACTIIPKGIKESFWEQHADVEQNRIRIKIRSNSSRVGSQANYKFVSSQDEALTILAQYFHQYGVSNQDNASVIMVYNKEELVKIIPGKWVSISVCPDLMSEEVFGAARSPRKAKDKLNFLVTLAVNGLQDSDEKIKAEEEDSVQIKQNGVLYGRLATERAEISQEKKKNDRSMLKKETAFARDKEAWTKATSVKAETAQKALQKEHTDLQAQIDSLKERKVKMTKEESELQDKIDKLLDSINMLRMRNEKEQRRNVKILARTHVQEETLCKLKETIQDEREKVEQIKLENGLERQRLQDLREKQLREERRLQKMEDRQIKERIEMAVKRSSFHALDRSRENLHEASSNDFRSLTIDGSSKDIVQLRRRALGHSMGSNATLNRSSLDFYQSARSLIQEEFHYKTGGGYCLVISYDVERNGNDRDLEKN